MKTLSKLLAAGLLGALPLQALTASDAPASAVVDEPIIEPVTTCHSATVDKRKVPYLATFGETVLTDADGQPQATISATAYVRADVRDRAERPVVFFFNGGPGASSSPLHFGALGPRHRTDRDAAGLRQIVENTQSLIDAADLVYVDPVGTGFSRQLLGGDARPYWSNAGDAAAVLHLVRTWLEDNEREASPVIMTGQSYGGYRLARMMKDAGDLNLRALVFISPSLRNPGTDSDLDRVFDLPSMATAAWYHERIERDGKSAEQWFADAASFARTEYLVGLFQGAALPAAERDRLAARMSALIGLPAETIAESDLRIDSETFLNALLADRKLLVGRLDARVTGPVPTDAPPDRPAAANDPALGLGSSNVITSKDIGRYLREELEVPTARDYVSLTLDVNFKWDRNDPESQPGAPGPARNIAAIMEQKPELEVLLMGGIYDLATPLLGSIYDIEHAGIPMDRVTIAEFEAGHSPYEGEQNLARMSELFRTLIAAE